MSVDLTCQACGGSGLGNKADPRFQRPICGACGGRGRRRPELHEWDALKDERDRWRAKSHEEHDLAIDTCNEVLENAGDGWDEDASIDYIAVKYVRWLEAECDQLREALGILLAEFGSTTVKDVDSGRPLLFAVIRASLWDRAHRALGDGEGPTTDEEEAVRDAEDALGDHYAYGSDDG